MTTPNGQAFSAAMILSGVTMSVLDRLLRVHARFFGVGSHIIIDDWFGMIIQSTL